MAELDSESVELEAATEQKAESQLEVEVEGAAELEAESQLKAVLVVEPGAELEAGMKVEPGAELETDEEQRLVSKKISVVLGMPQNDPASHS